VPSLTRAQYKTGVSIDIYRLGRAAASGARRPLDWHFVLFALEGWKEKWTWRRDHIGIGSENA
jgi:hypothetical protein